MSEPEKRDSTPTDPRQFIAVFVCVLGLGLFYIEGRSLILTGVRDIALLSLLALMSVVNIYYSMKTGKTPFRGLVFHDQDQPYLFRITLTTSIVMLILSIYGIMFLLVDSYV